MRVLEGKSVFSGIAIGKISILQKADTSRVWSIISTTAEHPASTSRAMRNIRKTCARHVKS